MNNLQYLVPFSLQGPCFRSNYQECSVKKGALRNFAKFTGKHLCQSLFFDKVQVPANLYEHIFYRAHLGDCFWCFGACLSTSMEDHLSIGGNSKNVRAVAKTFQCRGRPNLSESACQKSCESSRNWGIHLLKHVVLIMRIINVQ